MREISFVYPRSEDKRERNEKSCDNASPDAAGGFECAGKIQI